ncbi:hypothetical protein PV08_11975 [Exophiala spinifera]|uniref:Xylanolytic transcriptional activator regulatory domain-containing protein n=1 Tax=Exophiala spinifera TaxID=91928 RepID=A0A0D2BES0_9EURO|nr:uncharacterized protein PV08_11975 [Exophiala spinifera]KIW09874.1 hypothetical protein PV08_11975 [Exophiala spinifera]
MSKRRQRGQQSISEASLQRIQTALEEIERRVTTSEALDSSRIAQHNLPPRNLPSTVSKTPLYNGSNEAPWERGNSPNQSIVIESPQDMGGYHTIEEDIEFWGPRTSMSICSLAGIAWVTEKVKQPDFRLSATRFTQDVARRLKLQKRLTKERREDPNLSDAVRYTEAYFEEASDAALGIVRRSWFESRLRSFYNDSTTDDDPSWYALRNIVLASGCRIVVAKEATYNDAQQESWSYFENALSVHSELLCFRSSVMGVQALTLMAYFAEAISCEMLQYILVANAYRLACGQGLHVQPAPSWNLTREEKSLRQSVFWAIYCLEKQIACRSGRPSMIDDEEVNCPLPTLDRSDGSVNVRYIQACIRLNHLSSVVQRTLFKASKWRQASKELVHNVKMLQTKLEELRDDLRDLCSIELPLNMTNLPANLSLPQALSIQFLYYNLVWDTHTTLAHPWFRSVKGVEQHLDFKGQIAQSSSFVAETSRAAVLDFRFIHLDANSPMPVSYYSPLYAAVNLFINVLYDPSQASAHSDLVLMDAASGYFALLEYATDGQWSIPLVRDISTLARNAVERYRQASNTITQPQDTASVVSPIFSTLQPAFAADQDENEGTNEVRTP